MDGKGPSCQWPRPAHLPARQRVDHPLPAVLGQQLAEGLAVVALPPPPLLLLLLPLLPLLALQLPAGGLCVCVWGGGGGYRGSTVRAPRGDERSGGGAQVGSPWAGGRRKEPAAEGLHRCTGEPAPSMHSTAGRGGGRGSGDVAALRLYRLRWQRTAPDVLLKHLQPVQLVQRLKLLLACSAAAAVRGSTVHKAAQHEARQRGAPRREGCNEELAAWELPAWGEAVQSGGRCPRHRRHERKRRSAERGAIGGSLTRQPVLGLAPRRVKLDVRRALQQRAEGGPPPPRLRLARLTVLAGGGGRGVDGRGKRGWKAAEQQRAEGEGRGGRTGGAMGGCMEAAEAGL
jgi:hypothetical protein